MSRHTDFCTVQILTKMHGTIKRLHRSKFVALDAPDSMHSALIAKFPTSKRFHQHDQEHELMAYALDVTLKMRVRPKIKVYYSLSNSTALAMVSLASGEGLHVLKSFEGACLQTFGTARFVPIIVMDYVNGLRDMRKDDFRFQADNASLTSAAYVHLINEVLGSHDQRDRKNCFIDEKGYSWAIDMGRVRFTSFFSERRTVLKCLSRATGLQSSEEQCKAFRIIASKLSNLNYTHVEISMYHIMSAQLLPGVVHFNGSSSNALTRSKVLQCLSAFRFPGGSRKMVSGSVVECYVRSDLCKHGYLPSSTVAFHALKKQNQTVCVLDLSAIWARVLRMRLSEYASNMSERLSQC